MYTKEEAEGRRLKNPFDTVTEGIGINRFTQNFSLAKLDGAFRGTDMEAVEMSRSVIVPSYEVSVKCVHFSFFLLAKNTKLRWNSPSAFCFLWKHRRILFSWKN